MLAQTLAHLTEFGQEAAIKVYQHHKDLHWDLLWVFDKWLDLSPKSLFETQLVVIGHQSLFDLHALLL